MGRQELEQMIVDYLKPFNLQRVGIFGSYARNEQKTDSDIDLLIKFKDTPTLLQLVKIENELSKKLGIKVDLVTEGAIKNKRIKSQIQYDLKIIYDA